MSTEYENRTHLRAQIGILLLLCIVFFIIAYLSYITGIPVNQIFDPSTGTSYSQSGVSNVKLMFSGMFALLGFIMILSAIKLKYFGHLFTRNSLRRLFAFILVAIVILVGVNYVVVGMSLEDKAFFDKALSTKDFVARQIDSHYDSDDGSWYYKYSVEFVDTRTGNLIKATTGFCSGTTATLLYNPDNPMEVRFDYGYRPNIMQQSFGVTFFLLDCLLGIAIFIIIGGRE